MKAAVAWLVVVAVAVGALAHGGVLVAWQDSRDRVRVLEVTVSSVTNSSVVAEEVGELFARGKWLVVSEAYTGLCPWLKAKEFVKPGKATAVVAVVARGNRTAAVLLGLRQGNCSLVRPILLRRSAAKHRHGTMEGACKLVAKLGASLLVERGKLRALVLMNPEGKWRRAGSGDVRWKDIVGELNVGDTLWICFHNIVVLRPKFAEVFGFNAVIWGFSGAIIDLDTGLALAKHPL